jgi:primosomal protein N' (replication factor Y)
MGETVYAGIIIDQAHPSLDKIFHYSVPSNMRDFIKIGMRVTVPFGRKNSHIEGYVLQIDSNATVPDDKIKSIIKILDPNPLLNDAAIELIRWMKKEYHCLTIEAIHCFIPPGIRLNVKKKYEKVVYLQSKDDLDKKIKLIQKRSPNMAEILKVLDQHESMPLPEVLEITNSSTSSIKSLLKRGWIRIVEKEVYRQPYSFVQKIFEDPLTLSSDQARAIHMIEYALSRDRAYYFLIHGVTGSGKTEVYMQVVQKAILQKKQAIVLVPEISLTPQIVTRFKRRFGNQIAILHSRLSLGERFDEWRKINNQEVNIVIGARSAIPNNINALSLTILSRYRFSVLTTARGAAELL